VPTRQYTSPAVNLSSNDYPERRGSTSSQPASVPTQRTFHYTNEESTMPQASSVDRRDHSSFSPTNATLESKLRNGGVVGLQNLGNTVRLTLSLPFSTLIFQVRSVLYEFGASMSLQYETTSTLLLRTGRAGRFEFINNECHERRSHGA
jgi:hypothetical protein